MNLSTKKNLLRQMQKSLQLLKVKLASKTAKTITVDRAHSKTDAITATTITDATIGLKIAIKIKIADRITASRTSNATNARAVLKARSKVNQVAQVRTRIETIKTVSNTIALVLSTTIIEAAEIKAAIRRHHLLLSKLLR